MTPASCPLQPCPAQALPMARRRQAVLVVGGCVLVQWLVFPKDFLRQSSWFKVAGAEGYNFQFVAVATHGLLAMLCRWCSIGRHTGRFEACLAGCGALLDRRRHRCNVARAFVHQLWDLCGALHMGIPRGRPVGSFRSFGRVARMVAEQSISWFGVVDEAT